MPGSMYSMSQDHASPGRREFISYIGGGLGGIALAWMLGKDSALANTPQPQSALNGGLHHRAKARRIIQLFLNGGVSQVGPFGYNHPTSEGPGEKVQLAITAAVDGLHCTVH